MAPDFWLRGEDGSFQWPTLGFSTGGRQLVETVPRVVAGRLLAGRPLRAPGGPPAADHPLCPVSCVLKDRAGPWALGSRGTEGKLKAPTGRSLDAWTLSSVDLSGLLKP